MSDLKTSPMSFGAAARALVIEGEAAKGLPFMQRTAAAVTLAGRVGRLVYWMAVEVDRLRFLHPSDDGGGVSASNPNEAANENCAPSGEGDSKCKAA